MAGQGPAATVSFLHSAKNTVHEAARNASIRLERVKRLAKVVTETVALPSQAEWLLGTAWKSADGRRTWPDDTG